MVDDGFHAIVAAGAPFFAQAQRAQGQIQLVVDDEDVSGRHFVVVGQWANGAAAVVHEGLGLDEDDRFVGDTAVARQRFILHLSHRNAVLRRQSINGHKPHVMPVLLIFSPRIAQANNHKTRFIHNQ